MTLWLYLHFTDLQEEKEDIEKLERLARWLYRVTSDIALTPPCGLVLRVTSMLSLYSSFNDYWHQVKAQIESTGLSYRYATGNTPLAAQVLANGHGMLLEEDANSLLLLLKRQSTNSLTVDKKLKDGLKRVGLQTLAHVFRIPRSELAKRFGSGFAIYIEKLIGNIQHPVCFYTPPAVFRQALDLHHEVQNTQYLSKPLEVLLERLESFLDAHNHTCDELILFLRHRDTEEKNKLTLSIHAAHGQTQAHKWLELCELKLEGVSLEAPVIAIELYVPRSMEDYRDITDLFDQKTQGISAAELIAQLQAKLGEDAVSGIRLLEDDRPELAFEYCPPLLAHQVISHTPYRPVFILPHPRLLFDKVTLHSTAERITTGWWDNFFMQRDYFIARDKYGAWLWVFKTPDKKWFLHGWFS